MKPRVIDLIEPELEVILNEAFTRVLEGQQMPECGTVSLGQKAWTRLTSEPVYLLDLHKIRYSADGAKHWFCGFQLVCVPDIDEDRIVISVDGLVHVAIDLNENV